MNIGNKIFAYFLIVIMLAGFALAEKDSFILNEEYGENLYLTNNEVMLNSNLYGDLYSFSETLEVNELVQDDLQAITGVFFLKGTVGSDLRLISSSATIDGTVFGETLILGDYIEFTSNSALGGRAKIKANTVILDGVLKDDLEVKAEKVVINGVIEGNAVIYSSSLELGPDAQILGDLSSTRSVESMSSKVGGIITKMNGREDPNNFTSITFMKIGMFITLFLIGAVLVLVARKFTAKAIGKMSQRFFLSLLLGFVALLVTPFIAIALLFTIVGIPISFLLALAYIAAIILSFGMISLFAGHLLVKIANKKNKDVWIALLIGSLFIALISLVPVIFWIVAILLMFVSIGAGLIAIFGNDKKR